jgi:phenylpyruvate tautomerase PptA (4-oxalocrotonate tautomerase family)
MPLVRIYLRKGKDDAYRQAIGRVVYEVLVGVGVPEPDHFEIIGEHDAANFIFDPTYLGIHRSDDLVIIQITWNEGRTVEQMKMLYKALADGLSAMPGIRPEDVFVNLVEVKKENSPSATAWRSTHRERSERAVFALARIWVGQRPPVCVRRRPAR